MNSQNHDFVWCMGAHSNDGGPNAGEFNLDFNDTPPHFYLDFKEANFYAYSTSLCDSIGNLLFYSDGLSIWNSENDTLENGNGLNPGLFADLSLSHHQSYPSFLSGQCIPDPGRPNTFYMIHEAIDTIGESIIVDKLYYTLIDMQANSGSGKVLEKNVLLREGDLTYFGLCKHGNGRDWWLVVSDRHINNYLIYAITSDGIHFFQEIYLGPEFINEEFVSLGLFSPNGEKYVRADTYSGPVILDFDRCTGKISNPKRISLQFPENYGMFCSISSNSKYLYLNSHTDIMQIDLYYPMNSFDTIAKYDLALLPFPSGFRASQLAPNGKIYIASTNGIRVMHIIDRPNLPGHACNFIPHGIIPPKVNVFTMPHFPNYRLGPLGESNCDTLQFSNPINTNKSTNNSCVKRINSIDMIDYTVWEFVSKLDTIPQVLLQWYNNVERTLLERNGAN